MSFGASTMVRLDEDRVMEGLRVPPNLNTVQSVTFVLTQEPGKLKPKDLKAAIERNRAEKEQRAEEQRKLRAEGGGAGMLDLRGILSEERLNSSEGDPFKRQLREMAFLADVDDVEKLEIEKGFRISEDYLGSSMLSAEDINIVYQQRKVAALHKKRAEWRLVQGRTHTGLHPPTHPQIKAGTSAETAKLILALSNTSNNRTFAAETMNTSSAMTPPHFDPNRNDIWAKRMNTLRRFISLTSKWILRRRVKERMNKVMKLFHDNGAHTREEIRAFIENAADKKGKKGASATQNDGIFTVAEGSKGSDYAPDRGRPASVSAMVFSEPNPALVNREQNAGILAAAAEKVQRGESEITADMARRILFPQCNPSHGGSGSRETLKVPNTQALVQFDDRTFYQLKVKPEYQIIGYTAEPLPIAPIYFPTLQHKNLRLGAPEECALRPPADSRVDASDMQSWIPEALTAAEPGIITKLRESGKPPPPVVDPNAAVSSLAATKDVNSKPSKAEQAQSDAAQAIVDAMPAWLTADEDCWSPSAVNYIDASPAYRVFGAVPRRSELDEDWLLRPDSEVLVYERDPSLRSTWCSKAGFQSVNTYLLAAQESRNRDPPPPSGPNLATDYYLPDNDRHRSGLGCYAKDHLRAPLERDPDIKPLQRCQDKKDYLTDSESDNEDGYGDFKPTMERVRKLLLPPPPVKVEETPAAGAKGAKDKKAAPAPAAPVPAPVAAPLTADTQGDNFSVLEEGQRREEQVELLRDRKTLDLESTILRARKNKLDDFAKKLCDVSSKSRCLIQALPVQMPFHAYEDEVYKLMEPRMPLLNPLHVEVDLSRSNDSLGGFSMAMSPSRVL